MRVLVTGSTGFLGSGLMPALQRAGHTAIPLHRSTSGGSEALRWDPVSGAIDDLTDIDAVVHLAGVGIGEKRWSDTQKQAILESRTVGTQLLAAAVAAADPRPSLLISASAIGYYGNRGSEELTETSGPGDDFLADVCVQWEGATEAARAAGVRTVLARTGIVLSSQGGVLERLLLPFKLGLGGRIGSGDQWMSWISLEDEIGAFLHLLTADVSGPVNLTAPNPVTNRDFTETLGKVLHRPTLLPTPLAPIKLRFGAELVESLMLASQRVVGTALADSGYDFRHTELRSALEAVT